jgi:hypothetical protein
MPEYLTPDLALGLEQRGRVVPGHDMGHRTNEANHDFAGPWSGRSVVAIEVQHPRHATASLPLF